MGTIVVIGLIAVIAIPTGFVLIRFNRKRLHIIRCAKAASDEQIEAIYVQIAQLGKETPTCAVLARTNRRTSENGDWNIPVPTYIETWAGRNISANCDPDVEFRFTTSTTLEPVIRGQVYRTVPVPRHVTRSGKVRSSLSPKNYVASDPALLNALAEVCPAFPTDLLAYLLAAGSETFEFDPAFQARIGGTPSWVQDAEFPECEECRKRMSFVLQLPGVMLPGKPLPKGTFYFFACAGHPDKTKTVSQFA